MERGARSPSRRRACRCGWRAERSAIWLCLAAVARAELTKVASSLVVHHSPSARSSSNIAEKLGRSRPVVGSQPWSRHRSEKWPTQAAVGSWSGGPVQPVATAKGKRSLAASRPPRLESRCWNSSAVSSLREPAAGPGPRVGGAGEVSGEGPGPFQGATQASVRRRRRVP